MRENKISRRDFLKTAAVGAVGVGALLSGCASGNKTTSPTAGSAAKYVPGTYTSSQTGYNGAGNDPTVVVTVTFSETEITDVKIVGDGQSPELGGIAIERAQDQILAAQSPNIDGYASASKTTTAIKKGVADCIAQASVAKVTADELLGNNAQNASVDADVAAWGEKPVPITNIATTYTYDAVIIGCGTAGIPCALSAAESGLKTVILQKGKENTGLRTFVGARNTKYQKALGITIDRSAIIMDLMRYSSYYASQRHLALWADHSGEAIDWMGKMAEADGAKVSVQTKLNYTGMHFQEWPTYHSFTTADGQDFDLAGSLLKHFTSLGGEVLYETPMVQLVQGENGAITGVIAKCADGSYIKVNGTKGVVIATGGYANNRSMLEVLNPSDCASAVQINCVAGTDGDGLRAMHWAGADIDNVHTAMSFERAATLPGMEGGQFDNSNMFWMGSQPFLQVNKLGERVGNESCPYDYDLHLNSQQPGKVWISLFDQNWKEQYSKIFNTVGCASHMTPEFLEKYNGILLQGASCKPRIPLKNWRKSCTCRLTH